MLNWESDWDRSYWDKISTLSDLPAIIAFFKVRTLLDKLSGGEGDTETRVDNKQAAMEFYLIVMVAASASHLIRKMVNSTKSSK